MESVKTLVLNIGDCQKKLHRCPFFFLTIFDLVYYL